MSDAFSGAASAQRINEAFDIEASQREFMDSVGQGYDDPSTPMTRMEVAGCLLAFVLSCVAVGVMFYGAFKLAEVVR